MGSAEIGRVIDRRTYQSHMLAIPRLVLRSFGTGYGVDVIRRHMAELPTKDTVSAGKVAVDALVEQVEPTKHITDLASAEVGITDVVDLSTHANSAEVPDELTCLRALRLTVEQERIDEVQRLHVGRIG